MALIYTITIALKGPAVPMNLYHIKVHVNLNDGVGVLDFVLG